MQDRSAKTETWLWLAQRVSALVLAFCIVVHITTMIIAMQGGVSTAEIAGRVGGSFIWLGFYSVFIAAVSIHAPVGLRAVLLEVTTLSENRVGLLTMLFGLFVCTLGLRTVYGLFQLGGAG
jgi:fumarate reductase subunit C